MLKELAKLAKSPPTGICVSNEQVDQCNKLQATVLGPEDSPYSQGLFQLEILVPDNYPFSPPSIRFVTKVYHPNIDDKGRICLDLLKMPPKGSWRPTIGIEGLLIAVRMLLANPNVNDPLMTEIADECRNNKAEFEGNAKRFTEKYAK